jgi:hypothetical protein
MLTDYEKNYLDNKTTLLTIPKKNLVVGHPVNMHCFRGK